MIVVRPTIDRSTGDFTHDTVILAPETQDFHARIVPRESRWSIDHEKKGQKIMFSVITYSGSQHLPATKSTQSLKCFCFVLGEFVRRARRWCYILASSPSVENHTASCSGALLCKLLPREKGIIFLSITEVRNATGQNLQSACSTLYTSLHCDPVFLLQRQTFFFCIFFVSVS